MVRLPMPLFFSASRSRNRSSLPLSSVCAWPEAKNNISVTEMAKTILFFIVLPACERGGDLRGERVDAAGVRHVGCGGNRETEIRERQERDGAAHRTPGGICVNGQHAPEGSATRDQHDGREDGERRHGAPVSRVHLKTVKHFVSKSKGRLWSAGLSWSRARIPPMARTR